MKARSRWTRILALAVLSIFSMGAGAEPPIAGVYFDASGSSRVAWIEIGWFDFFVVAQLNGATASGFRFQIATDYRPPVSLPVESFFVDVYAIGTDGDPSSLVSDLATSECVGQASTSLLLSHHQIFAILPSSTFLSLRAVGTTNPFVLSAAEYRECDGVWKTLELSPALPYPSDLPWTTVLAGSAAINPCCSPLPADAMSWGGVKALY